MKFNSKYSQMFAVVLQVQVQSHTADAKQSRALSMHVPEDEQAAHMKTPRRDASL